MEHINKLLLFIIVVTMFTFFEIPQVLAEEEQPERKIAENVNYTEIEYYWNNLVYEYGGHLPEIHTVSFKELLFKDRKISITSIVSGILKYFFQEVVINGKLLMLLFFLTIISSILQTINNAFENDSVSQIAYFAIYLVLFYIALNSFMITFSYASSAIQLMSDFILALVPLILGLLSTVGNLLTVSFFHPLIIFIINLTNVIISRFILTLLLLSFLLMMVSYINKEYRVTYLAKLFKNISLGTLGIISTLFLSVMSIQGTASAIQDGLALKTAKFVTGNFIPVVGKTFTDAVDIVLSASQTLKNSIGIVGVVIIVIYALFPAMKILAIGFIYKFAAAILQPVGDQSIVKTLNMISNYTFYVLACLVAVSFMFFLSIVIIILASNISMFIK